ncbi:hypothetical protein H7H82_23675 [Mycobacterium heidelbergense]|uniref:Uncharacterized protein n=1 Tax=Mycobacterium heidelbergense TaxID=53376 RepID=A0A1X0D8L1_MYCHE|nr:hypothetical protein [Mycobacterium heidelbergense]MCV7053558.1 hypothetical protein [Mycobacterium heidelbergense]ORA68512.1 hypothetical protein BST25_22100 [Mycobacterium heidelbergense]BBZ51694.1 hypothetical protein MHEI_34110 [Mycobacterium heidelbergense]
MPTARRRHAITETDDITEALELAGRTWPDLVNKPGALLRQLILVGRNTLIHRRAVGDQTRSRTIEATAGALTGAFGPNYLKELREDWPE